MSLVFAYGSLVRSDARPARLRDFRRGWDVAMDNTREIPGYKVYVDPQTGTRPAVHVTFLSIRPDAGGFVNGVVYDVADLTALDARERNYERVDVTGLVDPDPGAPVWAYVGRPEARARAAAGAAVVTQQYHDDVRAAFARLGALDEFERTTDSRAVPLRALRRVDLPM